MDIFPTFADFAGAKIPEGVEGKSLRTIIEGKVASVREVLYTGYRNCMRAIRNDRWKLIRYPLVDKTQLFDLQTDPHELNNLAGNPDQAAKITELTARLQEQMTAFGDRHPLTVPNPASGAWTPPSPGEEKKKKK